MIQILDNALPNIDLVRERALALEFRSYDFEHCTFHGIAVGDPTRSLLDLMRHKFPQLNPTLTFFRKSPQGQQEPHFIHTDIDMGDWSAILYLNKNPPEGDGTCFWTYKSGAIESDIEHERSEEGKRLEGWDMRLRVPARFNRLVMFPSSYFHSRAIYDNWGAGDEARLTQVVFGTGSL